LTKDELNKMDDVYVYSKTLNEDKHSNSVHYFEFKHFNQPISIRLFCIWWMTKALSNFALQILYLL